MRVPLDDLRRAHAAGARQWPGVIVDVARFRAFAMERARDVTRAHCELLYLTCACVDRDDAALAAFERTYGPVIDSALARMATAAADADDIKQHVRERLFVGDAGARPRIAEYSGRGELAGWVRAVAVRTALNFRRTGAREVVSPDANALASLLPAADLDPELAVLVERYRAEVGAALSKALAALPDNHRSILRYHYAERLNIEQIGAIFDVHKTTAFRRLEIARGRLIEAARAVLQAALRIDAGGLASIARALSSHLDLTLSEYFRASAVPGAGLEPALL